MSEQVATQKIKLPEELERHLNLEEELYRAEDSMKLARSQRDKVFRRILKEKNLTKTYRSLREKIKALKRDKDLINDKNARAQYSRLAFEILKIKAEVAKEKEYIEVSEVLREKAREFRRAFKALREDYFTNIKPLRS